VIVNAFAAVGQYVAVVVMVSASQSTIVAVAIAQSPRWATAVPWSFELLYASQFARIPLLMFTK